jgi:hypothetical protein
MRMVKLWLNLLIRSGFGIWHCYVISVALKRCKYQTPDTTDTCFCYALGCQEFSKWSWYYFWNRRKMLTCHFSSCDLLPKNGSVIILEISLFYAIMLYSPLKSQMTFWSDVSPPCFFNMSVDFHWTIGCCVAEIKLFTSAAVRISNPA